MESVLNVENVWKIYYYIALFATILFLLKLIIFTVVGGDSEVSTDFTTETDTDISFNFVSFQSLVSFFMGFGWMGYGCLRQFESSLWSAFIAAFLMGVVFMLGSAFLMFMTKKLEKNVSKDKQTAVKQIGRAYTNFEPNGLGQIEVEISGQLSVVKASNSTDQKINAFDLIRVVKVENDLLYIEKVKK
ncbi:hypothetical protein HDR58_07820 [bacterium]|nr:hypothetical protein [bacterium]